MTGKLEKSNIAELMNRISKGDEDAFRELYDQYCGYVFKIVGLTLRNRDKVEELTQDIFIKIWRFASHYDTTRPFKPWLSRLVSNEIISFLRAKEEDKASLEQMQEDGYLPGQDFEEYRQQEEQRDIGSLLDQALNTLTDNQRQVVVLKFYEGQKIREIADTLKIGESAVKARLYSALETLQKMVGGT
jgi:RNA polymerase sigma-70 factor (ECF subfamily)